MTDAIAFVTFFLRPKYVLTIVFALLALLLVLLIWRTMKRWHSAPATLDRFDIHDLFMENGKASKGAVVMMGAFVVTSWFFVYYALAGKMSEGYFVIYAGAWITPIVARMITNAPSSPTAEAHATTTTTTTLSQGAPAAEPTPPAIGPVT